MRCLKKDPANTREVEQEEVMLILKEVKGDYRKALASCRQLALGPNMNTVTRDSISSKGREKEGQYDDHIWMERVKIDMDRHKLMMRQRMRHNNRSSGASIEHG